MVDQQDPVRAKWEELKGQSDSPLVKWSVVAIAVITVWVWVVEPLQNWTHDLADQVERNAGKASRLLALERNSDSWLKARQAAQLALEKAQQALFLSSSDTQAQASIQNLLQELAVSRNLTVESRKLIPAEMEVPVGRRLAIEAGLRGELIDVLHFMDDVGQSEKLFLIDQWIIQIERNKKAYVRFRLAGVRPAEIEA
jgi:hypothetical protein